MLVRETGLTIMRDPGGNFVSGYMCEDGFGPAKDRPVRRKPLQESDTP